MNRHPHAQWAKFAPVRASQRDLGLNGGRDGLRHRWEGGLDRVADGLEENTVLRRYRLP
jgi:hypothetical protein